MPMNEIPADRLVREMSAKIGEVITENMILRIQVAELSSALIASQQAFATEAPEPNILAGAYGKSTE